MNDCASVHVHVHGCASVHDLSIKMQVQYIYNLHKFTCHKKTVSLIFQEGGGSGVCVCVCGGGGGGNLPGDPHFRLLIDLNKLLKK